MLAPRLSGTLPVVKFGAFCGKRAEHGRKKVND
jgi:hypothetical protein